jgi:parallel beta-helix repeat protein
MIRKWLVIGIILLFVGTCIIPAIAQDTEKTSSRGNWLYVGGSGPGNYTRIQDAINASSDGDIVFVYDDSSPYYETITIDKEIKVFGEDKNSTTIDAKKERIIIQIIANHTSIENFTLLNATDGIGTAILIQANHKVIIKNNIIIDCVSGIETGDNGASYCEFSYNFIKNSKTGIESYYGTSHLFIHHNIIHGRFYGLRLESNLCIIANNVINDSFDGIYFSQSHVNKIEGNIFMNNFIGVDLENSFFNSFYRNSFIANNVSARFQSMIVPINNRWVRNYWDDLGVFPIKRIPGIYFIPVPGLAWNRSNFDWFPAQEPYDIPGMR